MNHPDDAKGYAAGLTERAYIATAAMQAILSRSDFDYRRDCASEFACIHADDLIRQLEKPPAPVE